MSSAGGAAGENGAGGVAGAGAGGMPAGQALDCPPIGTIVDAHPIPVNGQCLLNPGDEAGGVRVISHAFLLNSVVADGDMLFVGEFPISDELDPLGHMMPVGPRIGIYDRPTGALLGETATGEEAKDVRAVNATHLAWTQDIPGGDTEIFLHVAARTGATITEGIPLGEVSQNPFTSFSEEGVWLHGEEVFFQNPGGAGTVLRRVPIAGGEVTQFSAFVKTVVDLDQLLVVGHKDSFTFGVSLLTLQEGMAPPIEVGVPLIADQFRFAGGAVDAATSTVHLMEVGGAINTLNHYSAPFTGTASQLVAEHSFADDAIVIGSGPPGFIAWDGRYVWLLSFAGERVQLADLGQIEEAGPAVISNGHVLLVAHAHFSGPSDYLLDIPLP